MEKAVDLRQVNEAIRQLRERGDRVSRRSVQGIIGGSMTTVHKLLDEALAAERALSSVQNSTLSEVLVRTILAEIGGQVQSATEVLELRLAELAAREQEVLADLEGSELREASLEKDLGALRAQLAEERQASEKASAVAVEQQVSLREQLDKLEVDNNNLVRAGELARTESAKAQLQVERADLGTKKAEERVQELEGRVAELTGAVKEAEKRAAVAERHSQDLGERVVELNAQVLSQSEVLQQGQNLANQLRQELSVSHKATADADKRAALAEQQSESRVRELESRVDDLIQGKTEAEKGAVAAEQLRVELSGVLKAAADSDKRAALAEQKLALLIEGKKE